MASGRGRKKTAAKDLPARHRHAARESGGILERRSPTESTFRARDTDCIKNSSSWPRNDRVRSFIQSSMVDASRKKCEMTGCHTLVFTEVDSGHGHSGHGPHTHDEALSERRVIR